MPAKTIATPQAVAAAVEALSRERRTATIAAIRERIGGGSPRIIAAIVKDMVRRERAEREAAENADPLLAAAKAGDGGPLMDSLWGAGPEA